MAFRGLSLARLARPITSAAAVASRVRVMPRPTMAPSMRVMQPLQRAFSLSAVRSGQGLVDRDLSHQLGIELKFELEEDEEAEAGVKAGNAEPDFLTEFRRLGHFQLQDMPGRDEVKLTRRFGNEQITVTFSITDIENAETEEPIDEELDSIEKELQDEGADEGMSLKQREQRETLRRQINDVQAPELAPGEEEPESYGGFPVQCSILVEKDGHDSALCIEAMADTGEMMINGVVHYDNAKLAAADSADAERYRSENYIGPQFGHLEEDLQSLFERYLDERKIDTALAIFIPRYVEYKEQQEYARWLQRVQKFVDA